MPADLGFYDLRLPETREAQASLAADYGIDGFVYYHYWFNGRHVLERPFAEVLSTKPAFPFCLAWANEDWTRTWTGAATTSSWRRITRQRTTSAISAHCEMRSSTTGTFVGGISQSCVSTGRISCPTLFVRPRSGVRRSSPGVCQASTSFASKVSLTEAGDPARLGFDGAVEFQPRWAAELKQPIHLQAVERLRQPLGTLGPFCPHLRSYARLARSEAARQLPDYIRWPGVSPRWDNSPRRPAREAAVFVGSSPERYGAWLSSALEKSLRVADRRATRVRPCSL